MKLARSTKVGLVLVVAGFAASFVVSGWLGSQVPLEVPVSLAPSTVQTKEFTIERTADYEIWVYLQKSRLSPEILDCITDLFDPCPPLYVPPTTWNLFVGDELIASGASPGKKLSDSAGGGEYGFYLGRFEAHRGDRLQLFVDVLYDGSYLNNAGPVLQVGVDPDYVVNDLVVYSLIRYPTFLLGIGIIIVGYISRKVRRSRVRH